MIGKEFRKSKRLLFILDSAGIHNRISHSKRLVILQRTNSEKYKNFFKL